MLSSALPMPRFFYIIVFVSFSFSLEGAGGTTPPPKWECRARISAEGIHPLELTPDEVIALTPSLIWNTYTTNVDWLNLEYFSRNAVKSAHTPEVLEKILTYLLVFGDDPHSYEAIYRKTFGKRNSSLAVRIVSNVRNLLGLISIVDEQTAETRAMQWGLEIIKRLRNVPSMGEGNGGLVFQLHQFAKHYYPTFSPPVDAAIRTRFPHLKL